MDELDYYIRDGYTYVFLVEDMKFVESQVKMEFGKKELKVIKRIVPQITTVELIENCGKDKIPPRRVKEVLYYLMSMEMLQAQDLLPVISEGLDVKRAE